MLTTNAALLILAFNSGITSVTVPADRCESLKKQYVHGMSWYRPEADAFVGDMAATKAATCLYLDGKKPNVKK